MKYSIAVAIPFFIDRESLRRCLSSLRQFPVVFCVDGRYYPNFEYPSDLSDDGSREMVAEFPNTVLVDFPGTEVDKRNKIVQLASGYDILLKMDSDEYVAALDMPLFLENIDQGIRENPGVNVFCVKTIPYGNLPKIWYKPAEMEYLEAHNIFRHKPTGNITRSTSHGITLGGILVNADDDLRTPLHTERSIEYQKKLIEHEKPIKRRYGF